MVNAIRKISGGMVTATLTAMLVLALGACSSKKKAEDQNADGSAPQLESTPMNFDVAGSDSGKIEGLSTINFDYDKAALTSEAKQKIKGNVAWMKSHAGSKIQIEGHCDARGSIEYNLSLGERRAQSVKTYMVGLGISAARLSVISYGKEKPLSNGDTEADYATNRRANFVPLGN